MKKAEKIGINLGIWETADLPLPWANLGETIGHRLTSYFAKHERKKQQNTARYEELDKLLK